MNKIIIDSSVVLKWYLADEEYSQKALELLDRFVAGQLSLLAPSLLEYEVANALIIAKRRGRVDWKDIFTALEGFVNLEINLKPLSAFYSKVLNYCKAYNVSAYDASYLALAEDEGTPLVTADKKLYNSLRKIKWVKWIESFEVF